MSNYKIRVTRYIDDVHDVYDFELLDYCGDSIKSESADFEKVYDERGSIDGINLELLHVITNRFTEEMDLPAVEYLEVNDKVFTFMRSVIGTKLLKNDEDSQTLEIEVKEND